MTDIELEFAAKKLRIPNFRGVFMLDQLQRMKPRRNECVIVNLDRSAGPGTHWIAFCKRGTETLYYDSFGDLPPPKEIVQYIGGSSSIKYNFEPEQKYNASICGKRCIEFLLKNTGQSNRRR